MKHDMPTPEQQSEIDKIIQKPTYQQVRWMAADLVRQFPAISLSVTDYGHHVIAQIGDKPFLLASTDRDGNDILTTLSQYGRLVTTIAQIVPNT